MTVLCIETATKICSVAIGTSAADCALFEESAEHYIHAERLHILLEKALKTAAPDAIAVSIGPGSYTGLRIGVAAAKGLSFGLDVPLVGVQTLEGMTQAMRAAQPGMSRYIPMLDARRMEVYTATFDAEGNRLSETQSLILDEDSFAPSATQTLFFGDGSGKFEQLLSEGRGVPQNFYFENDFVPGASGLFAPANARLEASEIEDPAYFEPFYLKDFIAGKPKRLL